MSKYVGQSVKRKEDYRLLTGAGQFTADIHLPNMLEATIVRSTHAHALIKHIDVAAAKELDGVYAVITAQDIEGKVKPFAEFIEFSVPDSVAAQINPTIKNCPEELLAKDRVLFVGQAIAIVVAEDRYIAEDAAGLITVEYEPLTAVTDPFQALDEDTMVIHSEFGNNIQADYHFSTGNMEEVFTQAWQVLTEQIKIPRTSGNAIETRGVVATYDAQLDHLRVWSSTQIPFLVRTYIAKQLQLKEENIRVIAPDVGGGFGPKSAIYPEEMLIPYLAMKLKRPVKWIEDRMEHLSSTRHSRDQIHDVQVAFQNDGTIVGLKDKFILDNGAYNSFALTCAYNTATHMRGVYKIPNYDISCQVVLTNKAPNVPMRGAGRPEAAFVMDRVVNMVAEHLDMDPVEVILKNMIQPEEMPYTQNMMYRDGAEIVYDRADYPAGLKQALELIGYAEFRHKQKELRKEGKHVGIGISSSVEGTGVGPFEGARVRLDSSGQIMVHSGSTPHGQSHETTLAQVSADEFGVTPEQVTVKAGDTSLLPQGVGTFASRSAVTAGSAVQVASRRLKEKILAVAANMLQVSQADLTIKDGQVFAATQADKCLSLAQIAKALEQGPDCQVPEGMEPGVEETYYFEPPTVTWSTGYHIALVEVDKATGFVNILRYIVVHDCGQMLNPMVVEGQIQGGVAMGIGAALYEEIVYNENGQLLTGTYMDYLLPTSMEIPQVKMGHQEFLSTRNPLGAKGVGESGAISPPATIANAVIDALKPLKIRINDLPISPGKLFHLIKEAEQAL